MILIRSLQIKQGKQKTICTNYQKILILSFDKETLTKKELLSKKDINDIEYEDTITDSRGKKINWLREFFSNLNPDPYGNKK